MKNEGYLPKDEIACTLIMLRHILEDIRQRHADYDEIYNKCPLEEKGEWARKRAYMHGYMRDLFAAKYSLESYYHNCYEVNNGEG